MAKTQWLSGSGIHRLDLSGGRGNGPFGGGKPDGVVLHVNVDEHGTPDSFWRNNGDKVTPNFQVFKSLAEGGVHQILPFNWQPWCQVNGNFRNAAIETAGLPGEPLTPYQMSAIAHIYKIYYLEYGVPLIVTDNPDAKGFKCHKDGGASWGGHDCPGSVRAAQRSLILRLVSGDHPHPKPGKPSLRHAWPSWMNSQGDYFGDIEGPENYHGGIDKRERSAVALIQRRFQAEGFAPKDVWWADGTWEHPTTVACIKWHSKYFPHAAHKDVITREAWNILFTY